MGLTILVVDDELEVAQSLADLIEVFGHRVSIEVSSEAALARLRQQHFDGVFTDFRMPGLDGLALRRAIAVHDRDLSERTVIVTGDTISMSFERQQITEDPSALTLEKPFTASEVKTLLDRISAS